MFIAAYIFYGLVQAILINRYYVKDTSAPVLLVIIMTAFAPIVSALMILSGIGLGIKYLATPKAKSPGAEQ